MERIRCPRFGIRVALRTTTNRRRQNVKMWKGMVVRRAMGGTGLGWSFEWMALTDRSTKDNDKRSRG